MSGCNDWQGNIYEYLTTIKQDNSSLQSVLNCTFSTHNILLTPLTILLETVSFQIHRSYHIVI